jgi:hypothetical protein
MKAMRAQKKWESENRPQPIVFRTFRERYQRVVAVREAMLPLLSFLRLDRCWRSQIVLLRALYIA